VSPETIIRLRALAAGGGDKPWHLVMARSGLTKPRSTERLVAIQERELVAMLDAMKLRLDSEHEIERLRVEAAFWRARSLDALMEKPPVAHAQDGQKP